MYIYIHIEGCYDYLQTLLGFLVRLIEKNDTVMDIKTRRNGYKALCLIHYIISTNGWLKLLVLKYWLPNQGKHVPLPIMDTVQ